MGNFLDYPEFRTVWSSTKKGCFFRVRRYDGKFVKVIKKFYFLIP